MNANIVKNLDNAAACELRWQKAFQMFKVKTYSNFIFPIFRITQNGELGCSKYSWSLCWAAHDHAHSWVLGSLSSDTDGMASILS